MKAGDESGNELTGIGFAGLSSMLSNTNDIAADVAKSINRTETSDEPAQAEHEATAQSAHRLNAGLESNQKVASQPTPSGDSPAGKWILAIAGIIGFIWLISGSDNKNPTSSTQRAQPSPALTNKSSPTSTANSPPGISTTAPVRPSPQPPSRPTEEKPPIGTDLVLNVSQIRYCLAEKIRIDAARSVIDNTLKAHIDLFNAMVRDYNNRCSQFRYRSGTLESARSAVEAIRPLLYEEGERRLSHLPNLPSQRSQTPSAGSPIDAVVVALQQRLNELGYNAGSPDGIMGQRTRAAITAFQKDHGLQTDGIASRSLLERVEAAKVEKARPTAPSSIRPPGQVAGVPSWTLSDLTAEETRSIESACQTDRLMNGPAAYNACLRGQLAKLTPQNRRPDLSSLGADELRSIESACQTDRLMNGPAAYNACLRGQLAKLTPQNRRPDLSSLGADELRSIESACQTDRLMNGPAAYNTCLRGQLAKLTPQNRRPDLSRLSPQEVRSIESACQTDRLMNGPAAYNTCLSRQLSLLVQ